MSNHETLQTLMHNANFQMLEQLVSERNNAIVSHKTKEHAVKQSAYTHMSKTLQRMQNNSGFQARQAAEHQTGKEASHTGLGASNPTNSGKQSETGNNVFGGKSASNDNSADSDPSNWPSINGYADSYNQAMFNYFMLSISGNMDNPNALFDFLEALVKMLGDSNPLVQKQMSEFTSMLAQAQSPDPISGQMSIGGTYAKAIAMVMAAVAMYNAQQNGGDAASILSKMKEALGGASGNPFISQIINALGDPSGLINQVKNELMNVYGTTTPDTNILSFMMENIALNSKGLDQAVEKYKTSYMSMLIQRNFDEKKQKGANAMELLQFLIGVVCGQQNDQIGSFQVTIDALAAPGSDLGLIKGDLAADPDTGSLSDHEYEMKIFQKLKNLRSELQKLQEYENSPIMKNNNISSSIEAAINSVEGITANSSWGKQSLSDIFSMVNWDNPTPSQLSMVGSWFNNLSQPQSTSDNSEQVNQSYQDAINDLAVPEQKISGINDMEKTLFTNANQQASQSLSTVGGIIKDQMKLFSLMVQNQKA